MFFESHAHYDDFRYDVDRDALLSSMPDAGVDFIINAGADTRSSAYGIKLAEQYAFVYAAAGVHPHDAKELTDEKLARIKTMAAHPKVVAIGEIGLDFHYDHSPRDVQRYWFTRQLDLAMELGMPVIIHSRESARECCDIVKGYAAKGLRGVIHCYSGGAEMAMEYAGFNFYVGIGGVVTFPNARQLLNAAEALPMEKILLETDCPYLSPAPRRGERNDSRNLRFIAGKLAAIKCIKTEDVAAITKTNAMKLFFNQKNIAKLLQKC